MKPIMITTTKICNSCNGYGHYHSDSYNHRGEHVEYQTLCDECDGAGEVDKEEYGDN